MNRPNVYYLSRKLGLRLLEKKLIVAVAESCTGGGLAYALTSVAGSSQWFDCGVVTYTDLAKMRLLGVNDRTLSEYGEVSNEVAVEMANGVLQQSRADISVSITGVAGPTGGSEKVKVGTVCFGLAMRGQVTEARTAYFCSGRKHVRDCATGFALDWLFEKIN